MNKNPAFTNILLSLIGFMGVVIIGMLAWFLNDTHNTLQIDHDIAVAQQVEIKILGTRADENDEEHKAFVTESELNNKLRPRRDEIPVKP